MTPSQLSGWAKPRRLLHRPAPIPTRERQGLQDVGGYWQRKLWVCGIARQARQSSDDCRIDTRFVAGFYGTSKPLRPGACLHSQSFLRRALKPIDMYMVEAWRDFLGGFIE